MASSPMEFWGIEVKPGQPIKANPGDDHVIHLSQASLGESKNKAESVPLFVNVDGKKLGLGTLSSQNIPQLAFDLVFEKEFELSHNWKNGSVFFLGYKSFTGAEEGHDCCEMYSDDESSGDEEEAELPVVAAGNGKAKAGTKSSKSNAVKPAVVKQTFKIEDSDDDDSDDEDDDSDDSDEAELPVVAVGNGKAKADAKPAKSNAGKPAVVKQTLKIEEPSEDDDSEDDDEDDSEDDDSDEMSVGDSSDEEDEETPKKVESNKKRPAEAITPASTKKAKAAVTPQKTDGKKGGHSATPHPAKGGKKSGGQFSCSPCNKSFGSEGGLDSHKKAKHGGK